MNSSTYIGSFFVVLAVLTVLPSCRYFQGDATGYDQKSEQTVTSRIPFSTKEPDVFQTEVIISTFAGNKETQKKYFVAKKGGARFVVFRFGEPDQISVLESSSGAHFVLDNEKKTFRQTANSGTLSTGNDLRNFLTTRWINEKKEVRFENLGSKDGVTKYRVRIAGLGNSESYIFVDQKLNIPIKQEFYVLEGEKPELSFAVRFKNFKQTTEDKWFKIPDGYSETVTAPH